MEWTVVSPATPSIQRIRVHPQAATTATDRNGTTLEALMTAMMRRATIPAKEIGTINLLIQ
jgi:hypothetical protein